MLPNLRHQLCKWFYFLWVLSLFRHNCCNEEVIEPENRCHNIIKHEEEKKGVKMYVHPSFRIFLWVPFKEIVTCSKWSLWSWILLLEPGGGGALKVACKICLNELGPVSKPLTLMNILSPFWSFSLLWYLSIGSASLRRVEVSFSSGWNQWIC